MNGYDECTKNVDEVLVVLLFHLQVTSTPTSQGVLAQIKLKNENVISNWIAFTKQFVL